MIPAPQLQTGADGCAGCALYWGAPRRGQVEDEIQSWLCSPGRAPWQRDWVYPEGGAFF